MVATRKISKFKQQKILTNRYYFMGNGPEPEPVHFNRLLKMLFFSLVHPNLIYCIGPLSTMSSSNANKILKIQKKAIRSVAGATNREPSTPLFHKLKILPYNLLQKQAKLHFMHSVEYKYAPNTFHDIWQKNEARNLKYELRNNDLFTIPKINLVSPNNISFFLLSF